MFTIVSLTVSLLSCTDLSLQAGQQVMNADPANALQLLTDISQNFPTVARNLIKTAVSADMKKEIKQNQGVRDHGNDSERGSSRFVMMYSLGCCLCPACKLTWLTWKSCV